jgi:rhodanese-related sulfurtransferase
MTTSSPTSAERLVSDARGHIRTLSTDQLQEELQRGGTVLVDLREQAEREVHGAIPGDVHIPRGMLEFCVDPQMPIHAAELEPQRRIVLYCAKGTRSVLGALTLTAMGFTDVASLDGGFNGWRSAGGAVEPPTEPETAPWAPLLAR